MTDLVGKARQFATQGQLRIDTDRTGKAKPYDAHLKAVAALVASVSDNPEMIAAAWLHDTVADTPATLDEIDRNFGPAVAALVHEVTDVSRPGGGKARASSAARLRHFAKASPAAKTVKLADLIDTCHDVCKHLPDNAPVWLGEMAELVEALEEGDARLLKQARQLIERHGERVGVVPHQRRADAAAARMPEINRYLALKHARMIRIFARAFTAEDVSEPLRSFDDVRRAQEVSGIMVREGLAVAGVRREGRVAGYLRADKIGERACGAWCMAFRDDQVVSGGAPLSDVIEVLTRHDFCFVAPFGEVAAVIRRSDMLKPVVRMWLFGMLTLMEQEFTERIAALYPDAGWRQFLSPQRLQAAQVLHEERVRRGQPCDLLDCLQLSDKGHVLLSSPKGLSAFGFKTKGAAQRALKDVESLRNNLAHTQDIVSHDWPQIIRIARRIEDMAFEGEQVSGNG